MKMGAAFDCRLHNFGKNGEDFRQFSWWKGMFDAKYVRNWYPNVWGVDVDVYLRRFPGLERRVGDETYPVGDGGSLSVNGDRVGLRV